ncbi:hypothetical protein [Thiocapsa rosea]|uniref:7-cyano-7-deazaguanine synthase in queuosine biosynthesis n=1 Tax=Thiocapsa rosea TaxID=69360 RepID=A0A495VDD2_9GAMM|nr:hypothetical protein [Thiocapsa rosea]RKT47411.1 hypothetical protein BDD21_4980 [Thiocapsa rosea]
MIIHPVEIIFHNGRVRITASVSCQAQGISWPEQLWYELPRELEDRLSLRADGFLVALLLQAMSLGEDIHVEGAVSGRLLRNLEIYQSVFSSWFPAALRPVGFIPRDIIAPPAIVGPPAVAAAFSGGVDSTLTLLDHSGLAETDAAYRITHVLFVHGFDIPLAAPEIYDAWAGRFRASLLPLGVELIEVQTNVRQFVDRLPWIWTHGSALGSVALMLEAMLTRFYIPASSPYSDLEPWGSHPITDPLMSTETMEIHHDGCLPRVDKILRIADWPGSKSGLRVCWEHPDSSRNCCRCHNCVMTMIGLELAGTLSHSTTFPESLDYQRVSELIIPIGEIQECESTIARAVNLNRGDLASPLGAALRRSRREARIGRAARHLKQMREGLWRRLFRSSGNS